VAESRRAGEERAAKKEELARLIKEYKESHDEAIAARIRQLNWALHEPKVQLGVEALPARKPFLDTRAKNILKISAGLLGLIVWIKVCSGPSETDKGHNKALEAVAVRAVKDNFEPKYDILILNPDTATGNWFAVENYGVYKCQGECVVVTYSVDVMPSGATDKKRMHFQWLYDTKRPLPVFANTEARTYFQPK